LEFNLEKFNFRKSIEDALVGYYISTVSGKFVYANKQLLKIFGYETLDELKKVYIPEDIYLSKDERERFLSLLREYGKVDTIKIKIKRKDGEIAEILLSGRLFDNGQKLEGWIFDVTKHEKLKKEHQLFTRVIEENSDAIFITDSKGFIIYKNKKFGEIIGNVSLGTKAKDILPVSSYTENTVKQIVGIIKEHKHWIGDLDIINDKNELIPCAVKIFGLFDEEGNIENYISVFRDVREKRELETQLKQAQKMELIGLMTGSIIHDINNILTGIGYNVELSKLIKDSAPEKLDKYLDSIDSLIEKANTLLQKMLNFTRKSKISKEAISVMACFQDALSIVSPVVKKYSNIKLNVNIKCKKEKILANKSSIVQVLLNLILNAIDAIIEIKKSEGNILIECEQVFIKEKSFIRIVVRDNGIGIPEELKDKIFEPFFTLKTGDSNSEKKGTGLGLAIVMKEIKELGGCIDVISEVNKFTEFIILIPEYDFKEKLSYELGNSLNESKEENYRIVILDDDVYFKNSLSEILNFYGFEIISFDKAKEFCDSIKELKPDLIILDFVLDDNKNAKDILDFMYRENFSYPVFIITGYIDSTVLSLRKYSIVKNILEKPITSSELINKINFFFKSNNS